MLRRVGFLAACGSVAACHPASPLHARRTVRWASASPATEATRPTKESQRLAGLHRDARAIFAAALEAADPTRMITSTLALTPSPTASSEASLTVRLAAGRSLSYDLGHFDRILVVGAGKGACRMAAGVEAVLGERITEGLVVTKYEHSDGVALKHIGVLEAGHPVPDANSVEGARRVSELVSKYADDSRALVLVLLSGGGSSVIVHRVPPLPLDDVHAANRALLRSSMPISEVNYLRKHMDAIKGGGLLERAGTTPVLALILSDVIGDDLQDIASAPTVPFQRDYAEAVRRLDEYNLRPNYLATATRQVHPATEYKGFPVTVYKYWLKQTMQSTPTRPVATRSLPLGDSLAGAAAGASAAPTFVNLLVGSNRHSLVAAAACAERLGYQATILTDRAAGEARDAADWLSRVAIPVLEPGVPAGQRVPRAFLAGGETTVSFEDASSVGVGGRNQELALSAALRLREYELVQPLAPACHTVVLAGGTDGTDGPTDATGAVVDGRTVDAAAAVGLDARAYLTKHDSYHFFSALDQARAAGGTQLPQPPTHLKPGPTGTNVADVYLALTK